MDNMYSIISKAQAVHEARKAEGRIGPRPSKRLLDGFSSEHHRALGGRPPISIPQSDSEAGSKGSIKVLSFPSLCQSLPVAVQAPSSPLQQLSGLG